MHEADRLDAAPAAEWIEAERFLIDVDEVSERDAGDTLEAFAARSAQCPPIRRHLEPQICASVPHGVFEPLGPAVSRRRGALRYEAPFDAPGLHLER